MTNVPCDGRLVVTYDHRGGGRESACEVWIEVECPGYRCYWYDPPGERKEITLDGLLAIQAEHDKYAIERAAL